MLDDLRQGGGANQRMCANTFMDKWVLKNHLGLLRISTPSTVFRRFTPYIVYIYPQLISCLRWIGLPLSAWIHSRPLLSTMDQSPKPSPKSKASSPRDRQGWDGKLRVQKRAVITNAEALSDPEYSDEDAPPPESINADEGISDLSPLWREVFSRTLRRRLAGGSWARSRSEWSAHSGWGNFLDRADAWLASVGYWPGSLSHFDDIFARTGALYQGWGKAQGTSGDMLVRSSRWWGWSTETLPAAKSNFSDWSSKQPRACPTGTRFIWQRDFSHQRPGFVRRAPFARSQFQ